MNVLNSYPRINNYFLKGKIASLICDTSSNLYKVLEPLNKKIVEFIDSVNRYYLGAYPCKSNILLKEHLIELGIEDEVFNNIDNTCEFTYSFPICFGQDDNNTPYKDWRLDDIIVKKYLMNNNNYDTFKLIAGQYNACIEINTLSTENNHCGFPYTFTNDVDNHGSIVFCGYQSDDNGGYTELDNSYYTIDTITGEVNSFIDSNMEEFKGVDSIYKNQLGESVIKLIEINVYNVDTVLFSKLKRIYNTILPLGSFLVINLIEDANYNCTIKKICDD